MNSFSLSSHANGSIRRPLLFPSVHHISNSLSYTFKPFLKELQQVKLGVGVTEFIKNESLRMLEAWVDSTFQFVNQPTFPSQRNFAPVDEIGEKTVTSIEGEIPADFPEGIYIRNGPNPLFGALQSTVSPLGRSSSIWVEGEGMLHAIYFTKNPSNNTFTICYKNRYVESETFKIEKEKKRPCFLPAVEGDSLAILAAYLLNQLRFGKVNKYISNTNVFEHSGRCFSIAEHHIPQEIHISSLDTLGNWDVNGEWNRPFTAHPKKAPGTGELVITGADAVKPFLVLGVISADGKRLTHKVDIKLERSILCHDIGVTERYNIILDMPLTIDVNRLLRGGSLMKYEKESYARIGVMPRYGDAESIKWFHVHPYCTFHLINAYEDGDEVIVRGCRALESIIPGPEHGLDKFKWFSRGLTFREIKEEYCHDDKDNLEEGFLFAHLYEWRLNVKNGGVRERSLTGREFSMDFPMINENFIGLRNKFAYVQVADSAASSICGLPMFGSLVKFSFGEVDKISGCQQLIKVEHHQLGENQFCSGSAFVPRPGGSEEEDGWIISYVHNEQTNISQVHIIDTKRFESKAAAKITLPQRVPYGFHGTFIKTPARSPEDIGGKS